MLDACVRSQCGYNLNWQRHIIFMQAILEGLHTVVGDLVPKHVHAHCTGSLSFGAQKANVSGQGTWDTGRQGGSL